MIQRLRPLPDREAVYPEPHDHRRFGLGHHLRVEVTKVLGLAAVESGTVVADLSCGNGAIAVALAGAAGTTPILGDYAPGWEITGPLEETIATVSHVDLFVCSETLEHLDDPVAVLVAIRDVSKGLLLSTPIGAWDDGNAEHCWAWDREGVEGLLAAAKWTPTAFATLDSTVFGEPYDYGVWTCR